MQTFDVPYQTAYGGEGIAHLRQFDHMAELVDLGAQHNDANNTEFERSEYKSLTTTASFAGTVSMAETVEFGRSGWPEGTRRLADIVDSLDVDQLKGTSAYPQMYHDVTGEEPDVGAFLSGEPENMINWDTPVDAGDKTIEFVVNTAPAGRVSTAAIVRRGAGVVAAAQALTANGYSVGVTAAFPLEGHSFSNRKHCTYVPLAAPGEYFDLDTVAFGLSNPSVFRRLIFATLEQEPANLKSALGVSRYGGYGYVDKLQYIPRSPHRKILVPGGYNEDPLQAAQGLIDGATGRIELPTAKVSRF